MTAGIYSKYTDDIPIIEFTINNTIFTIQHIRCNHIDNVPEHIHPKGCYELHLIKKGYGKFIIEGNTYPFVPGTMIFIGPGLSHQKIVTDDMETVASWVNIYASKIDSNKINNNKRELIPLDELFLNTSFWIGTATEELSYTMDSSIKELILKDPGYQQVVESNIKTLIVKITRNFRSEKPIKKDSNITALKYPVIMDDYFMVDYKTLNLHELSRRLNLSIRQTQRLIFQYYGLTFQEKKLDARMKAAKMLIEECSELSMSEISIKLGYPSLEYFSTTFRNFYGISPREYRKSFKR